MKWNCSKKTIIVICHFCTQFFQLENKLMKAADKAEGLVNRGETVSKRWYHKLTTGEDLRLKDLQVFTASFTAGVGLGIVTGT